MSMIHIYLSPLQLLMLSLSIFNQFIITVAQSTIPHLLHSSEFLSLAPVSDGDILKAIKRLKPSKSVGLDDILCFIIKGCSAIFIHILRHVFNFSLTLQ
jgi:hypothetical protein